MELTTLTVKELSDEELAEKLEAIVDDVRQFGREGRNVLLVEAARRIAGHAKFKAKVRDRAIAEADKRSWCGEFDNIIRELGMAGRFATYRVVFTHETRNSDKLSEQHTDVLARDADHAWQLVNNAQYRSLGVRPHLVRIIKDGEHVA